MNELHIDLSGRLLEETLGAHLIPEVIEMHQQSLDAITLLTSRGILTPQDRDKAKHALRQRIRRDLGTYGLLTPARQLTMPHPPELELEF